LWRATQYCEVNSSGWRQRFLGSTRGKILHLLRAESRTVNDLAAALDLTDNAIRAHLAGLERDGLVQQLGTRPGSRKPHTLYGLASEAERLFPNAYGSLLTHILSVLTRRLPLAEVRASLREVGRTAAREYLAALKGKTRDQRINGALDVLKALGGDATTQKNRGKLIIQGNGCPLFAATAQHPEACLIVEALLSEIIETPVKERCHHGDAPRCCFEVG
jgi:predicted ArsR family transcriptional regulator